MRSESHALRLTVYVEESKQVHHKPLYAEIIRRAHAAGLAGATAFRGFEGYGASSRIHTARVLSLSEDLPVIVVIVDDADRVRAFLPELAELVENGLAVLDEVELLHFGPPVERDAP